MTLDLRTPKNLARKVVPFKGETIEARLTECRCGASCIHVRGGNIGEVAKATGFMPFPHSTCTFVWVCPSCMPKIIAGLNLLREHFGEDARNIQFNGMIMRIDKAEGMPNATF